MTEIFYLLSVIFLSIKSLIFFTGGSNSGFSNIVKNKASKNHCIKPPPRHQTRKTKIKLLNATEDFTKGNFQTSFSRLSNLQIVVVFPLFLRLDIIWAQTVHWKINSAIKVFYSHFYALSKIPKRPHENFFFECNVSHSLS